MLCFGLDRLVKDLHNIKAAYQAYWLSRRGVTGIVYATRKPRSDDGKNLNFLGLYRIPNRMPSSSAHDAMTGAQSHPMTSTLDCA